MKEVLVKDPIIFRLFYGGMKFTMAVEGALYQIYNNLLQDELLKDFVYNNTIRQRHIETWPNGNPKEVFISDQYDKIKYISIKELKKSGFTEQLVEKLYKKINRRRDTIRTALEFLFEDIFLLDENREKYQDILEGREERLKQEQEQKRIRREKEEQELKIRREQWKLQKQEEEDQGSDFHDVWMIKQIENGKVYIPTKKGVQSSNKQKLKFAYIYAYEMDGEIVYIGCTRKPIAERLGQHIACSLGEMDGQGQTNHLYKAMREGYGRFIILFKGAPDQINQTQLQAMECGFIYMYKPKYNFEGVSIPYRFTTDKKGKIYEGEYQEEYNKEVGTIGGWEIKENQR